VNSKAFGSRILFSIALALVGATAGAQDWALKMFDATSHDFQTVARGAKAVHHFKIKNIYQEPAHISGVRSSCGCTTAQIIKPDLKTFETGEIVAELNTRAFNGFRTATVTVTLDAPFPAEVQLNVSGFIRSDVVLQPGSIDLGTVDVGEPAEKTLSVSYAGRDDWKIVDAKTTDPHFQVELRETSRGSGRVAYDVLVRLMKNAPPGYIKDQLILVTNDVKSADIPVELEGRVLSALTVSPASLFMGAVRPGQKVTKQLVIRGKKPFKIMAVDCKNECFAIELPTESKSVHLTPIVFTAGDKPGKITCPIRIHTDQGEDAVAKCTVFAEVVEPAEAPNP